MTTVRRIIGIIIVLVALAGIAAAIYALIELQPASEQFEREAAAGFDFVLETLDTTASTLSTLETALEDSQAVIETAAETSRQASQTLDELKPAVQDLADMVAFDLPNNIQAMQDTMPALKQATAAIDASLRTLAGFQWGTTIPLVNYELSLGLGIEYDPEVPLDQSVAAIEEELGEIAPHLTALQGSLLDTHHNLGDTAQDTKDLADDLEQIGTDLAGTGDALEAYDALLVRAQERLLESRRGLREQIRSVRWVATGVLIWLALSQAAPFYLGCSLVTAKEGARGRGDQVQTEEDPPAAQEAAEERVTPPTASGDAPTGQEDPPLEITGGER